LARFLDEVTVHVRSGSGGDGCLSFRREKFIEFGGPNGGNGGHGGSIVAVAQSNLNTLIDFRYRKHFFAPNGVQGMGRERHGRKGEDCILEVPVGTEIFDNTTGALIADLTEPGQREVLLKGGRGGLGNACFKTSTNRAPRRFTHGEEGVVIQIQLRLRLLADVGLVGLPNAGKSTILSVISNAKPKIADYPFATLHPQLGLVDMGYDGCMTVADLPGLIDGAHLGCGLGDRFLAHIEKCAILWHLVDGTSPNVKADFQSIRQELELYGHGLEKKKFVVAMNKIDALTEKEIRKKEKALQNVSGCKNIFLLSGITKVGVRDALFRIFSDVQASRKERQTPELAYAWHP
jgi:GTP-binding protein